MTSPKATLLLLLLLASPQAFPQVYRCTVNGKSTYQQMPCSGAAKSTSISRSSTNPDIVGCYTDERGENKLKVSGNYGNYIIEAFLIRPGRTFTIPMRLVPRSELPPKDRSPALKWLLEANPKEWTSVFFKYVDQRTRKETHQFVLLGNHEFKKSTCR